MNWILNKDFYLNTETGECYNKKVFEAAIDFIEKKSIDSVPLLSSSYMGIYPTRGRKPKEVVNPYYQHLQGYHSYSEIPQWLDDVLYGAGNIHEYGCKVPVKLIYFILKGLPVLSSSLIKAAINSKRALTTGDVIESRYAQYVMLSAISAIKSIEYHLLKGKTFKTQEYDEFDLEVDTWLYKNIISK